jgi:hypothetical protein
MPSLIRGALAVFAAGLLAAAALPAAAQADVDPAECTAGVEYDPSITRWDDYFDAHPEFGAIVPFASGAPGRSSGKNTTANLHRYFRVVMADANATGRVAVKEVSLGSSELGRRGVDGRELAYWVISTPENIARFEQDGAFWAGIRDGRRSAAEGLAAVHSRPAVVWVTATPHGNEPAGGEAIARQLYELVARRDCANMRRLQRLDIALAPVRNPDGRDGNVLTTAWGLDPGRDAGVRTSIENSAFLPEIAKYPGLVFIEANQQDSGYFFPPDDDPVHHEIPDFALDVVQQRIGPKLRQTFNDQSSAYQNYRSHDLFAPTSGDTVASLLLGAAGMTFDKGVDEAYGKQVYDLYLAIDTTINLTANEKADLLASWVELSEQARRQGEDCSLQENKLVSPLNVGTAIGQPQGTVCGYFFRPDIHEGDVARLMRALREVGVRVYSLDQDTATGGVHEYGMPVGEGAQGVLARGTLWVPMSQPQKHWIEAVLGEDPFIPYDDFSDVVTWSYGLQRGLAGDGHLTIPLPLGTAMTELDTVSLGSVPSSSRTVYAFDTDAMEALGLVVDLLAAGVNVYRATQPFDAGGVHYDSGAALVDAASLSASGADLAVLAAARNTPVKGLDGFPVAHKQLTRPKIGLYTGGATVPANPLDVGRCSATAFCEALFVLTQKDRLPASLITPVTSTELGAGNLGSQHFTALVNPGSTIAPGAGATALQAWVNSGGNYVGYNAGAVTSVRNAGVATLNVASIPGLNTPGSTFDATFDTTNPVAWGFDRGGWIYREATATPVFDPATLGSARAAMSYAPAPMRSYGFSVNALGDGQLGGRPAVVDAAFGAGHAVLFGFNPFYRSWKEQDERLVLNALLYPADFTLPPSAAMRATAAPAATALAPLAAPLAKQRLPAVGPRPAKARGSLGRHVLIRVARKDARKLRAAVRAAKLSTRLRERVSYKPTSTTMTLVVRNVRTADEHARRTWVSRIMGGLKQRAVRVRLAQL